jgi:hypothetical protein
MILSYLDAIFSIRDLESIRISSQDAILNEPLNDVHRDLLKYCYLKNYNNAFIFNNEISLIRDLEDTANNEIVSFIQTNIDWDLIIIGINELTDITLIDGYTRIYKLNDTTTFHNEFGYIASKQFMEKVINNQLTDLNTYVYKPTFLNNTPSQSTSEQYIVTQADNLSVVEEDHIKYVWNEIIIKIVST